MNILFDKIVPMTELQVDIASWLKSRRSAQGISIRQLARNMNLPHTTLANVEKGIKPSINIIKSLAEYFSVEESYLFVISRIMDATEQVKGGIIESIVFETNELPPDEQQEILEYVRYWKGKKFKKWTEGVIYYWTMVRDLED